jgi:hypothetical protein
MGTGPVAMAREKWDRYLFSLNFGGQVFKFSVFAGGIRHDPLSLPVMATVNGVAL